MGNTHAARLLRSLRDESGVRSLADLDVEADVKSALERIASPELVALLLEWIAGAVFVLDGDRVVAANADAYSMLHAGLDLAGLVARGDAAVQTSGGTMGVVRRPLSPRYTLVLLERAPAPEGKQILRVAVTRWRPTARQAQILEHVLEGLANKEIAVALGVSVRTVEVHITALFEKAGVDTRTRLIAKAREIAAQAAHGREEEGRR